MEKGDERGCLIMGCNGKKIILIGLLLVAVNLLFTVLPGEVEAGTTPPGAITNLSALTGSNVGEIDLSWTAPGDDNYENPIVGGKYRIDYSTDPLYNFTTYYYKIEFSTNTSPGDPQSYTLDSLNQTTYYIRVYTADEVPNWSPLSNGATAFPGAPGPGTVSLSAPTIDGHIRATDTGGSPDPDTFERQLLTVIRCYYVNGNLLVPKQDSYWERGFIEWDISSIPDEATITDVIFKYHGEENNASSLYYIYSMENEPFAQSNDDTGNEVIYDDVADGNAYVNGSSASPEVGESKEIDLGSTADSDLQSNLTTNWFAIGLKNDESNNEKDSIYSSRYGTVNPSPTLYVTFTPGEDTTSPAAITNLSALTGDIGGTVKLTWTAPGDDGTSGDICSGKYRIKYSQDSNYDWNVSDYDIEWTTTTTPGASQTRVVENLTPGATYYFRIWTGDEIPNWSTVSNSANAMALIEDIDPSAITDLQAQTKTQIELAWTAPGDNGTQGQASFYNIRYSTTSPFDWDTATVWKSSRATAGPYGTPETETITGLTPGTTYYFRIKAYDYCLNWSLSNQTTGQAGTFIEFQNPMGGTSGVRESSLAFGDYDNDGDLDLAVSGEDDTNRRLILFKNNNGTFTLDQNPMGGTDKGVDIGSLAFGDYDNDGDLDLAVSGYDDLNNRRLILFKNNNGTFTLDQNPMGGTSGVYNSSIAFGDYDNDGDLDLAVSGYDGTYKRLILFKNNNGNFTSDQNPMGGTDKGVHSRGSLAFGDYDNDGDLDLAVGGLDNTGTGNERLILFKNNNGTLTQDQEPMGTDQGVWYSSLAFGDYDNDGDLDLAVSGQDGTYKRLILFKNNNGNFTEDQNPMGGTNKGVMYSSLAFGDYDNDGDLDLAVSGEDDSNKRLILFKNNNGTFTEDQYPMGGTDKGVYESSLAFGDYDNDGDLDLAVSGEDDSGYKRLIIYKNMETESGNANTLPGLPQNLTSLYNEGIIKLSWSPATDGGSNPTPQQGLYYNIRVGTGTEVSASSSVVTGIYGSPMMGNYLRPKLTNSVYGVRISSIGLTADTTYYWTVQAIDTPLNAGGWASLESIYVPTVGTPQAPAAITNLSALTGDYGGEVKLTWSAPGDDGWTGDITDGRYGIKYATYTSFDFNGPANFDLEWSTNTSPGASQAKVVTGLTAGTTYYFRIWTADEVLNWSGISNGATAWAQSAGDTTSPAAITNLTGLCDSDTGDVTLSWSTPGDDGWNNTLADGSKYRIDYSTYVIAWSTNTYDVEIPTHSVTPYTQVSHTITGLTGNCTYYFRIWTADEIPNWSGLSNGATVWVYRIKVWDGGGGDNYWSTGANWTGDIVPGVTDGVVFNDTSNKPCTIDVSTTVASFSVQAGSTITITASGNLTVTGDFSLSTGTFNAGSTQLTVGGNWSAEQDATFNYQTSTVTFNASSGTKNILSSGTTFYNLVITTATTPATYELSDNLYVQNNFTLLNGTFDTNNSGNYVVSVGSSVYINGGTFEARVSTITCGAHWDSSAGTFNYGTSTVDLTGTGDLTTAVAYLYNLTCATTTKTTTMQSDIHILNTLTLGSGGTLTDGASSYTVSLHRNGGTPLINGGATITLDTIVYAPASGTVTVAGGNYEINFLQLYSVDSNVTFNLGGDITVDGVFYLTAASGKTNVVCNTQDKNITAGFLAFGAETVNGSTTLDCGTSTIDIGTNGLIVADAGGSHTLNLDSATVTCAGNWQLLTGTGTITQNPGTSTVTFDNATSTSTLIGSTTFYILISTTTGKNVKFTSDTVIGVTNHLNFENITLRSISGGATWYLNLSGTQDVSNVDVRDSNASGSTGTIIAFTSTDSGNNTEWDFGPPEAITDLTGECDSGTGDVTLSWSTPGDDYNWQNTLVDDSKYRIDYSSYSIAWSTENYKVDIPTHSVAPHTEVSHTITGLQDSTSWYFRIWTADEIPLWSGLSNGATVWVTVVGPKTYTWTGGGAEGDWDDTDNWSGAAGYPDDANDKAVINLASSENINTGAVLTIGELELGGSYSGTLTLGGDLTLDDSGAWNGNLTIGAGTLDASGATEILCETLTVSSGTFSQGSANLTVSDGQATGTAVTVGADGTWSNTSTGNITLGAAVSSSGTITLDGDGADPIIIASSDGATQRNWQGSGSFNITDVNVSSQTCTGGTPAKIYAVSSTDGGNNTNWVFLISARYWVGGAGNWSDAANHWSATSGGAAGASKPVDTDTAIFDVNSGTETCTINEAVNIKGLLMKNTYSGTITQGANTITIGADNAVFSGGTFTGGSATITMNGSMTISGTAFTSTSGTLQLESTYTVSSGSFVHNSGRVYFSADFDVTITPGSDTYYRVEFELNPGTTDHTISGTLYIAENLTVGGWGDVSGGTIKLNGTGDQIVNCSWGNDPFNVYSAFVIDKASGGVILGDSIRMRGAVTIDGLDSLNLAGHTLNIDDVAYTNNTTFTVSSTGTLFFEGTDATITPGTNTYYNVTFECYGTKTISGTFYIAGNLYKYQYNPLTGGTIEFNGTSNQTINANHLRTIGSAVVINNSGGVVVSLVNSDTITMNNLTINAGSIFNVNGKALSSSNFTNYGTLQLQGGESVSTPSNEDYSTVEYTATSGSRAIKNWAYKSLKINGAGGTFTLGTGETLDENLIVSTGTFDLNSLALSINGTTTIEAGAMKTSTNTVTFGNGTGDDSVSITGGELHIESDDTSSDIVLNLGSGSWSNTGGTIIYDGSTVDTDLLSSLSAYNNLTIDSAGSTYTLDEDITVNGDLTINDGTLDTDANNYAISVGGDWNRAGGTFTVNNSTVTFITASSTSTLTGSTTFYGLVSTASGKNVKVSSDTVIDVTGHLNFEDITLRSTLDNATWYLNLSGSGTQDVSGVDVRDSNASGGDTIIDFDCPDIEGCYYDNNTNWDFGPPAAITDLTGLCDSDTGDVTLSWSTPGDDDWTGTLPSGSKYIIDYSSYSIQWSTTNYKVSISTSGVSPHTEVSHTITGLTGDSTYYFQIWTRDDIPNNWSGLSNGATIWVNPVLSVTIEPSSRPFGEVDAGQSDILTDGFTVGNTGNITQKYQLRLTGVPTEWTAKNVAGSPEWEQAKILGLFTTQSPLSATHFNDNPPDTGDGDIVRTTTDDQATSTNFAISEEGVEVKGYNVTVGGIRYLWFRFDAPSGTSITNEQFLTVTVTAIQQ